MNTGLKCFHIFVFKRYEISIKNVFITYAVWVQEITALLFIQTENNYKQIKINIMSNTVEVRIDETSFNCLRIHSSYIHTHTHLYTYTLIHNSFFSSQTTFGKDTTFVRNMTIGFIARRFMELIDDGS